jgi:hypothetical protein
MEEDLLDFSVDELTRDQPRQRLVEYARTRSIDTYGLSRRDIVVALKLDAFRDLGWSAYNDRAVESSDELAESVGMDMTMPDVDYDEALLTFEPVLAGTVCADHTREELAAKLAEFGIFHPPESIAERCALIARYLPSAVTPGRIGYVRPIGTAMPNEETPAAASLRRIALAKPRLESIIRSLECRNLSRRDLDYYARFLLLPPAFITRDITTIPHADMCRLIGTELYNRAIHEYRTCMRPRHGHSLGRSFDDIRAQAIRAGIITADSPSTMTRAELCRALGDRRAIPPTIIARARQLGIRGARGKTTQQLLREMNAIENRYPEADANVADERAIQTTRLPWTLTATPLLERLGLHMTHDRWARLFVDELYRRGMRYDTADAELVSQARAVLAGLVASGLVDDRRARIINGRIDAYVIRERTATPMLPAEYDAPRPIRFGRRNVRLSGRIASGVPFQPPVRAQPRMDAYGMYMQGMSSGEEDEA